MAILNKCNDELEHIHHFAVPTGTPLAKAAKACARRGAVLAVGRVPAAAAGYGVRQPSAHFPAPQRVGSARPAASIQSPLMQSSLRFDIVGTLHPKTNTLYGNFVFNIFSIAG